MTELIEITVQKAAIEWLQALGYTHKEGNSLKRELKNFNMTTSEWKS